MSGERYYDEQVELQRQLDEQNRKQREAHKRAALRADRWKRKSKPVDDLEYLDGMLEDRAREN